MRLGLSDKGQPAQAAERLAEGLSLAANEGDLGPMDGLRRGVSEPLYAAGWSALHAAAVEIDGRLVVAPGASGAGKSTLALELLRAGYRASDELVFLRRSEDGGSVEALVPRLPIAVTAWTLERHPWAKAFRSMEDSASGGEAEGKIALDHPGLLETRGRPVAVALLLGGEGAGRARRAKGVEAARALMANLARFPRLGSEGRKVRRGVWSVFDGLMAGPVVAFEGRVSAEYFVAEAQAALKEVAT